eukprot:COSAG02_NODE_22137_length_762_cov_1.007541_1_plen_178_part_10
MCCLGVHHLDASPALPSIRTALEHNIDPAFVTPMPTDFVRLREHQQFAGRCLQQPWKEVPAISRLAPAEGDYAWSRWVRRRWRRCWRLAAIADGLVRRSDAAAVAAELLTADGMWSTATTIPVVPAPSMQAISVARIAHAFKGFKIVERSRPSDGVPTCHRRASRHRQPHSPPSSGCP